QVPHDGTGRRGTALRNLPFERNVRSGVQGVEGSALDAGGTNSAPALDRRASSAVECDSGRYEPGRAPSAPARGGFALPALAASPLVDETGNHLSLANLGPQRPGLRPLDGARSEIHRYLVAASRSRDSPQDSSRGAVGQGSEIKGPVQN